MNASVPRLGRRLPLWIDAPGLRVAHACGQPRYVDHLAARLKDARLTEELLPDAIAPRDFDADAEEELTLHAAVEAVTKGPDVAVPRGMSSRGKDGPRPIRARVRWWDRDAVTLRAAAMPYEGDDVSLSDDPLPERLRPDIEGDRVQIFGHYWMSGVPRPLGERAACVDYSVARGGRLVAFRWDGEPRLEAARFEWVPSGRASRMLTTRPRRTHDGRP